MEHLAKEPDITQERVNPGLATILMYSAVNVATVEMKVDTLTIVLSDMEFLEVLMEGLNRVLLVRGGGREVITIYS